MDFPPNAADLGRTTAADLLEGSGEAVCALDREWRIVYLNREAERLLQVRRQEVIGRGLRESIPESAHSALEVQCRGAMEERVATEFRLPCPSLNAYLDVRANPTASGLALYFRSVPDQVPARPAPRQDEDAARRRLTELEAIYAAVPVGLAFVDRNLRYVWVSEAMAEINGRRTDQIIGRTLHEVLGEELAGRVAPLYRRVIETGQPIHRTEIHGAPQSVSGPARDYVVSYQPARSPDGTILGVCASVQDVTEQKSAERAMKEGEARYRALVEASSQVVWVWRPGQAVSEDEPVRRWWEKLTGQPPARHRRWIEAVHPDDRPLVNERWSHCLATGTPIEIEFRVATRDGDHRHLLTRAVPIWTDGGAAQEWVGMVQDVTERRVAEDALARSEERFRLMISNSPDIILFHARDLKYEWISSPRFQDAVGRDESDFLDPEQALRVREIKQRVMASGIGERYETSMRLDGEERHYEVALEPRRDGGGQINGLISYVRDITERKRVERALEQSEERYHRAIRAGHVGVWDLDLASNELYLSPDLKQLLGYTDAELANRLEDWCALVHPEDKQRAIDATQAHLEGRTATYEVEVRRRHKDGRYRWFLAQGVAECDAAGRPVRLTGSDTEITVRKEAELALAESRQRFQVLFENTQDALLLADDRGRYVDVNPAACELTGYSRDELLQKSVFDLTPAPDGARGERVWAQFLADGRQQGEYALVRKDGRQIYVDYRAVAHVQPGVHLSACRDVTDRALIEQERKRLLLREQEARRVAEAAEQRAAFLAEAGQTLSSSLDYEETFPKLAHLAVPRIGDWCAIDLLEEQWPPKRVAVAHVDPKMVQLARDLHERYPPRQDAPHGLPQVLRTGQSEVYPEISDGLLEVLAQDDEHLRLLRALGLRSAMVVPLKLRDRACGAITIVSTRVGRHYGQEDLKFAEELARRAAAAMENARLYGEVDHASKAKDQFLAVLSHELRTPLTPVVMSVAAMEMDRSLSPEVREDLAMIRRNIELETKLIDDLLDVTRIQNGKLRLQPKPTDVHALAHNVLKILLADVQAKSLNLKAELDAADTLVDADPARLQQVFWNLIKNAIKFTPESGNVHVRTCNPAAGALLLEITDDGAGMDPAVLPRIFNAFDQGDPNVSRQFGGLGLGLAISKKLVEMHGGTIHAHSDGRGRGARFCVELPTTAAARKVESEYVPIRQSSAAPGVRVLLVEDHADTLRMLSRLLARRGYGVVTADSAAAALKLLGDQRVDVVVSDIGLPDMTGHELMRQIRQVCNVPAIAVSGYGMDGDLRNSRDAGFSAHITKPVDLTHLEAAIRNVVARGVV